MTQDDPLARFFYETECIRGTWSVKELRRQIATNLYFRSGVSKNPKELLATNLEIALNIAPQSLTWQKCLDSSSLSGLKYIVKEKLSRIVPP